MTMRTIRTEHTANAADPWQEMANAVILQAVKDYRQAQKTICAIQKRMDETAPIKEVERDHLRVRCDKAMKEVRQVERFFCSESFCLLSDVDGMVLLNKLRKEAA